MKSFLIVIFSFLPLLLFSQEARVRIVTQESWPPGENVPVTVEISRGDASGFARFYHDLPQGFIVENVINGGADFFRDNNQVNYVWLDLPEGKIIIIQYLARADDLLAGSFKITGRFDYIIEGKKRVSVVSETHSIKLDRSAEVESVELPDTSTTQVEIKTSKIKEDTTKEILPSVDFRVQVSISSQRFSREELEDRIGSKLRLGINVLRTGNMFKYQSGSFETYKEASSYLSELKAFGVTDAFIVAFSNNSQISINEARAITEK